MNGNDRCSHDDVRQNKWFSSTWCWTNCFEQSSEMVLMQLLRLACQSSCKSIDNIWHRCNVLWIEENGESHCAKAFRLMWWHDHGLMPDLWHLSFTAPIFVAQNMHLMSSPVVAATIAGYFWRNKEEYRGNWTFSCSSCLAAVIKIIVTATH